MECPKCGKKISKTSNYCKYCGEETEFNMTLQAQLFLSIAIYVIMILGAVGKIYQIPYLSDIFYVMYGDRILWLLGIGVLCPINTLIHKYNITLSIIIIILYCLSIGLFLFGGILYVL